MSKQLDRSEWAATRIDGAPVRRGNNPAAVARNLEVNRTSVTRAQRAARITPPPHLNATERKWLITALKAGAMAHGYRGDLWTLRRVAKLIETLTGQRYAGSSVSSLLQRVGFPIQRPNGHSQSPEVPAVRRGKAKRWPALEREFVVAVASGGVDLEGYSVAAGCEFSSATDAFEHYLAAGRAARPELFPFLDQTHYTRQAGV